MTRFLLGVAVGLVVALLVFGSLLEQPEEMSSPAPDPSRR